MNVVAVVVVFSLVLNVVVVVVCVVAVVANVVVVVFSVVVIYPHVYRILFPWNACLVSWYEGRRGYSPENSTIKGTPL